MSTAGQPTADAHRPAGTYKDISRHEVPPSSASEGGGSVSDLGVNKPQRRDCARATVMGTHGSAHMQVLGQPLPSSEWLHAERTRFGLIRLPRADTAVARVIAPNQEPSRSAMPCPHRSYLVVGVSSYRYAAAVDILARA
jgi:hypothetical protein